ncbi:hypothetical protein I4U23_014958 [Adineta vaga]|nr:hypothetical protein I4U23_014958 [Adineta vaga]
MSITPGQQQLQQKSDYNVDFPKRNVQLLRTALSDTKQISLDEVKIRKGTNASPSSSTTDNPPVKRTSSSPAVNRPVGSNRLFSTSRK